ncbi:MAG: hypothetical protein P4M00_21340 [Azospirillaceae bacterium]|nr:hypothetical protein [Azospirillaceae bacterium]
MDFVEQKTVKLLAMATRQSAAAMAEALCLTPDKRLLRAMLTDIRAMLDEFEENYFDDSANGTESQT